jgi:predicted RNase H-like nuclease
VRVPRCRVLGVDGCRGGWLAALVDDREVSWIWTRDVGELIGRPAEAIAIDIPIGLPDSGRRACDVEARRQLGRRGVTVFAAPLRPVLECASYGEARQVLAALGGPSMSAQAFGIVAAVRAVDAAITPADEGRVIEAHPELAFLRMTGTALAPKKTTVGAAQRAAALDGAWRCVNRLWPGAAALVASAPRPAAADDALDALACAWVARRWACGEAVTVGDGTRDERGLVMRIVS